MKTRRFNSKMTAFISTLKFMMHTYDPEAMSLPSTSYTSQFQRYCLGKILKVKVTMARSNVKLSLTMTLYTYNPHLMSLPSINFLHLPLPSHIARTRNYRSRSLQQGQIKVTLRCCTPTTPTNVPTKYQLPTPYGCQDIAQTNFYRSRSLWQSQRSNQGHTMTLHTYTP